VERFYARGVHGRTDIHRGYLNFGLWEDGVEDYVAAAENLVARLGKLAGLGPGSRLLDVGCGFGTQDVYLERAFGPLEIDGLDVTWSHVERARRRAEEEGVADRVRFHHGSATRLPFADESFSHIIGIEGPVHFHTRRDFFDEALRVLRPGGVLALADYTLARRPRNIAERGVFWVARSLWRVPSANVCTTDEYREQVIAAGFGDVRVEGVGALTFPGYYREQQRPEFQREMERLQGRPLARVGRVINVTANWAYRMGVLEYLLVRAQKAG
jgi:erythromycin 3''-O-methyltransferase